MKNTNKCHVKKDDKVKILAGKDKGKIGKVLKVINKKNRILVENINIVKRHTKPSAKNRQGGIVETEAPIHWTNVMLMCNKCMSPSESECDNWRTAKRCAFVENAMRFWTHRSCAGG